MPSLRKRTSASDRNVKILRWELDTKQSDALIIYADDRTRDAKFKCKFLKFGLYDFANFLSERLSICSECITKALRVSLNNKRRYSRLKVHALPTLTTAKLPTIPIIDQQTNVEEVWVYRKQVKITWENMNKSSKHFLENGTKRENKQSVRNSHHFAHKGYCMLSARLVRACRSLDI